MEQKPIPVEQAKPGPADDGLNGTFAYLQFMASHYGSVEPNSMSR